MQAADIMSRRVVTIRPDSSVEAAARLMLRHHISGLPVVDASGAVVGMVTEGDLLRRAEIGTERQRSRWLELLVSPGRLAQDYVQAHARKISEIMIREVVSIAPSQPLAEVVALMERHHVKRLPVIDKGRLVGVVSRADLLDALINMAADTSPAAVASDQKLRKLVLAEIDKQLWAPRASIDVSVRDGEVELQGVITDERERAALRIAAENVAGVKAVHDHLAWVEPVSGMVIDAPRAS
jgi:CBS domain-containing protein